MKKSIAKAWVKALRSDEYKQGNHRLCRGRLKGAERWCCLGVLADIALDTDWTRVRHDPFFGHAWGIKGSACLIPSEFYKSLGFESTSKFTEFQSRYTILNDEKEWTFGQIADQVKFDFL